MWGEDGVRTFDPQSPGGLEPEYLIPGPVLGFVLACPANGECVFDNGQSFDPASPCVFRELDEEPEEFCSKEVRWKACAGIVACEGEAEEDWLGFTLAEGNVSAMACPSTTQCTAVGEGGIEWTFDPLSQTVVTPTTIDEYKSESGTEGDKAIEDDLSEVACPSTTQCTALDFGRREITFDPDSPAKRKVAAIAPSAAGALSCPSVHQCTSVAGASAVTFDPTSSVIPSPSILSKYHMDAWAISCPSASRCVVAGFYADEFTSGEGAMTFDPAAPEEATATEVYPEKLESLGSIACPTDVLCVAIDGQGRVFIAREAGPPAEIAPPTISGVAEQGQTLTEEHGEWTNDPTSFSYQWESCDSAGAECEPIEGATSRTYLLAPQDVGHTIRVQETASNEAGSGGPATSDATAVVLSESSEGGPSPDEQGGAPNESEMPTTCPCGKPVNTASGVFWHTFTDAHVPGLGVPLDFARTYTSSGATIAGPLGYGWTDSYAIQLRFDAKGNPTVVQEDAAVVAFKVKAATYQAVPGVLATLVKNGDGTYTFKRNATNEQFVFSSAGDLVSEIDRRGYKTQLTYNGAGELTKVTDQAGRSLTFAYAGGHLVSIADPLGHTTTFEYDPAGDLVKATDPLGRSWRFTYNAQHLLLTMTDPRGGVAANTYDSSGRVTKQVDAAGRVLVLSYSGESKTAAGGTTTVTDARGIQTQYRYKSEELVSETLAAGTAEAATTSYQYDPATFGPTSITDADGKTTAKVYDARGDVLSTTDSLGKTTKYTYDGEGDRLTTTDALGVTTTSTYDAIGNLLSTSTPLTGGGASKWAYTYGTGAQVGDRLSTTNPDGKTTSYAYDAAGDPTSTTDPLSNKTTMTYDADGRLLTRTSPNGGTATNVYDADGELTKTTDPLGHSASYAYDANGNRISTTDANGHTTTFAYDADNELVQTTQPAGSTTKASYDGDGNIVGQTDGNGHTTSYTFNALNQTASTTDPDGRTTKDTYDGVGNLLTSVNPSGQTTTYSYDADRRTTAISYSDGTTPAVHESYDANGRRVSLSDGTGTSAFVYDNLGRLTSETDGAGATSGYAYDPAGNVTQITYPNGKAVSRTYDADSRLTGSTDWLGNTTTFSYDGDGNLTNEHLPGTVSSQSAYNAADQLTGITDSNTGGSLASFTYARDPVGQVASSTTTGAVAATDDYSYDGQNRITADNAASYGYDAGNDPTSFNGQPQRFDAADQLLATGSSGGGEPGEEKGATPGGGGETPSGGGSPTTTPVEHGGTAAFHASAPAAVTVAATAKTHSATKRGKLATGPLTTTSANDLLLAFVAAQGPARGQRVRSVTGDGLHWSRVTEATSPQGASSIWQARAPRPLGHTTVTATLAKTGYGGMLDVTALAAGATLGPVAKRSGAHTSPSLPLKVSAAATIFAVAHDASSGPAPRALGGNLISDQARGGKRGGTSWTLSAPGGTAAVGLGGAKPASWSLAAVAVLPAATAARATTAPKLPVAPPTSSAAPLRRRRISAPSSAPASAGETTYAYNPDGDRTAITTPRGTTALSYDQANRLTAFGEGVRYSYDGDGLRASKAVAGETTTFAWDKAQELPLLLEAGSTSYIYGPSGQPTEQIHGITATYLLGDQQGSTRLITDAVGAVVGTYSYDAWGNVTGHTGEDGTNLQYDGQYTDAETGYQYLRARYYDPGTGQFLTVDPLVASTLSPHGYVADNPVNLADASGRDFDAGAVVKDLIEGKPTEALLQIQEDLTTDSLRQLVGGPYAPGVRQIFDGFGTAAEGVGLLAVSPELGPAGLATGAWGIDDLYNASGTIGHGLLNVINVYWRSRQEPQAPDNGPAPAPKSCPLAPNWPPARVSPPAAAPLAPGWYS